MRAKLRVLRGDALVREVSRLTVPSLDAQPVRPGEMPESIVIELETASAARAVQESARTGIPITLWLRLAVEASRHLRYAATALNANPADIEHAMDAAASASATGVHPLQARRQLEYARSLRGGVARTPRRLSISGGRFEIAVPDQLLASWSLEAASAGLDLAAFVSELVLEAPFGVVTWEATAAELGRSLGEWIYAEALALRAP